MATCHGGTGKPSEKDSDTMENDVDIHNEYQADVTDFENVEPDHHARLRELTNGIDYLPKKVEANKTQPTDAIRHLECELNRSALTLHLSTLLGSLDEVLQQYTDTLCTGQKEMSFVNTQLPRYHNFQQQQLFTIRRLVH